MVIQNYNAYLVETVTGQVGTKLNLVSFSYNEEINDIDSATVTISKQDIRQIEPVRLEPHWSSILITKTVFDTFGSIVDETPKIAGIIQDYPSVSKTEMTFGIRGIRSALEKRRVIREEDPNKRTDITFKDLSLGAIAQEVVKLTFDQRPGGSLPIAFGSPYESFVDQVKEEFPWWDLDTHERSYPWWNLANNSVDEALTKLSGVRNGPDIMFRVEFTDDTHQYIKWVMYHGTKYQPQIAQKRVADFDLTSSESGIVDWSIKADGSPMTSRVWATGAGEGSGTVVTFQEDLTLVERGYPFYETLISDSQQTRKQIKLLERYARTELAVNQKMVYQLSLVIKENHPKNPLGSWFVGDSINVTIGEDAYPIQSKTTLMKVIGASGGSDGLVTLELQEW